MNGQTLSDPIPPRFGERPGIYQEIHDKIERALRNNTGCTFSNEQLVALLRTPIWTLLMEKVREELLAKYDAVEAGNEVDGK
jgi:hypothetical protein